MFRKTYDSLSMAVHVELLADADKLCLKTWMQTDKMEYDFLIKYNDQFSNAWKLNALGSMDHDRPLNRYTLDEGLAGKKLYEEKEEDEKEEEVKEEKEVIDSDQEDEEDNIENDQISADDIFGGEVQEESESEVESEEVKDPDNEEVEDKEEQPEKKASDNAQKSFFDTFDENQ